MTVVTKNWFHPKTFFLKQLFHQKIFVLQTNIFFKLKLFSQRNLNFFFTIYFIYNKKNNNLLTKLRNSIKNKTQIVTKLDLENNKTKKTQIVIILKTQTQIASWHYMPKQLGFDRWEQNHILNNKFGWWWGKWRFYFGISLMLTSQNLSSFFCSEIIEINQT